MLVKEFRIPLPLDVDEFRKGQLYSVAEACKNETGGGEGAEFVKQIDFFDDSTILPGKTLSGTYTFKIYRLKSKSPWVLQKILPDEAFEVHEESWNAYPYCKTVITNPGYMGENFTLVIESLHLPDNGCSENPLNAPLKRDIMYLDICDDVTIGKYDYCADLDPKLFLSERTGRGQLKPEWVYSTTPIMCCYKVVTVQFKWIGLTNFVEKTILKQYPKIFTKFHREAFCWVDYWYDLTDDELREFEAKISQQLLKQLAEPEKRGATLDDRAIIN